jgi:hypothetical protein
LNATSDERRMAESPAAVATAWIRSPSDTPNTERMAAQRP